MQGKSHHVNRLGKQSNKTSMCHHREVEQKIMWLQRVGLNPLENNMRGERCCWFLDSSDRNKTVCREEKKKALCSLREVELVPLSDCIQKHQSRRVCAFWQAVSFKPSFIMRIFADFLWDLHRVFFLCEFARKIKLENPMRLTLD